MAKILDFEELEVWQIARQQAKDIFQLSAHPGFDLKLASRVNASAGSVMDNIAEDFNRYSNREFARFLVIARGSNGELRSQLQRISDQGFLGETELQEKLVRNEFLGRKSTTLIRYLRNREPNKNL